MLPNKQRKIVLFGSYGWDDGKFMVDWVQCMKDYDFDVVDYIAVRESASEDEILKPKQIGGILAE